MKQLLVVAAHPDDEVLGCFGAVARLIREGHEAYTLILGRGKEARGSADQDELRLFQKEMLRANESIGIKEVFTADFPDNAFDSVPLLNIVKKIEEIKEKIAPDIIFTHHVGDINVDHQVTHRAVLTATRPKPEESVKTIYAMEIPSSTEWNGYAKETAFVPDVFFDISGTIESKMLALAEYKSELMPYPHPRSMEHVKSLAKTNGAKVGLKYCENFVLIRSIMSCHENTEC
ncbi:MAG: PIG-L family deacetylase [Holosporaceae bacterium]|jgi:LmbE family N-acetylglucosaminyl deacetylase|nr:PIG-L family deacetylase [Holosporaceae bacterium]